MKIMLTTLVMGEGPVKVMTRRRREKKGAAKEGLRAENLERAVSGANKDDEGC